MKTIFPFLLLVGLNGVRLFAADTPDVTVRCLDSGTAAARWINPPISVFDDQPVKFDAEVTAPLGARLGIYADLYQTAAGGWSVPLSKNLQLSQDLRFDGRTDLIAPCTVARLPTVRGPVRILLKLSVRTQGPPESTQPAGTVTLFVYPRQKPGEWKKLFAATLSQAGITGVAVFGKDETLRQFFRRQQIRFDDLGADWPAAPDARHLYLADSPPLKPDRPPSLTGKHVALFLSNPAGAAALPGVYSTADIAGGAMVNVTLPAVLDRLDDDPRNQQIFLEIVGQALRPRSPSADANPMPPEIP